jgi:ribosomal protein S1
MFVMWKKLMRELLEKEEIKPLNVGKIIKGKILSKEKGQVLVDLSPWGTGKIYGFEFQKAKEKIKDLKEGEEIWAKVTEIDNEEGVIELSLNEILEELKLEELREKKEKEEKIKVKILGANKGGLLTQIKGFPAFLPLSQMEPSPIENFQEDNREDVLKKLKEFIGKEIEVRILTVLNPQKQIILTQKGKEVLAQPSQEVEGKIVGFTEFGAFVDCQDFEGFLEKEEIENNNFQIGEKIKAKVKKIERGKVYLTLK